MNEESNLFFIAHENGATRVSRLSQRNRWSQSVVTTLICILDQLQLVNVLSVGPLFNSNGLLLNPIIV